MRKRETKAILLILTALLLPAPRWLSPQAAKGLKPGAAAFKNPAGKEIRFYKKSYALLIGVWDYQHWRKFKRENIEGDLANFKTALEKQAFEVDTLLNPTSRELKTAFESFRISKGLDRDHRLLILFSGHGYSRDSFTKGYIVPRDAPLPRENLRGFLAKTVDMVQLRALAQQIEARHVLFLFDSCFSGTIFRTRSEPVPETIKEDMTHFSRQFITAGKAKQLVPEKSVFMPAVIRGISGKADIIPDRFITGVELFLYVQDQVKKSPVQQHPQYGSINISSGDDEGNMVFAVQKLKSSLPPPTPDLDVSAQIKWNEWQKKFDRNVEALKQLDEKTGISAQAKLQNWVKLRDGYKANNPFSSRDDEHRFFIQKKILTWKGKMSKKPPAGLPVKKKYSPIGRRTSKYKRVDGKKSHQMSGVEEKNVLNALKAATPQQSKLLHSPNPANLKETFDAIRSMSDAAINATRNYKPYFNDGKSIPGIKMDSSIFSNVKKSPRAAGKKIFQMSGTKERNVSRVLKIASSQQPKLLHASNPVYPKEALDAHVEGKVTINATIDIYGRVINAVVVDGHRLLRRAAINGIRKCRYKPYFKDGKPIPVMFTVVVTFRLNKKK